MKSMLYVGATLMIGASIYGFVDYQKTNHKKEFTEMYKEPTVTEPVTVVSEKKAVPSEEKKVAVKEKVLVTKKDPETANEEIISVRPIADDEKITPSETKNISETKVTVTPSKNSSSVVKHKKRKLSTKLFSRGALDERYIKEEINLAAPDTKKESGKIEKNKEQ